MEFLVWVKMEKIRIRESLLYEIEDQKVRCNTCQRRCEIKNGDKGFCKTRKNIGGKLYTLVYGDIFSINANPIEKKPFFHFWPGTQCLTVGTWSCNFACPWCQNHDISKNPENIGNGDYISPERFIELMKMYNCQGTSISFNEPTLLFEYSLDVFDLAKKEGYYNTYVTNGYMTKKALELLIDHGLDAMNIDLKGDQATVGEYCKARVERVWESAILAKKGGVWVEMTTLVILGVNDDEECLRGIAKRIKNELGEDTPWHVTRYHPAYKFYVPATPISSLEKARELGIEEGLNYVYAGNVPGHPYENTYCPGCNELLIKRYAFDLIEYRITRDKKCPKCGKKILIINEER
jgi:pyruvate formate lyase activating enzyme